MDNPRTIVGWRSAHEAVERLLRGDYSKMARGDGRVALWLEMRECGQYAEAHWDRPADREGWSVSPVSGDEALGLRNRVGLMGRYPLIRR